MAVRISIHRYALLLVGRFEFVGVGLKPTPTLLCVIQVCAGDGFLAHTFF